MALRNAVRFAVGMACIMTAAGCSPSAPTRPWSWPTDPAVFGDTFRGTEWMAFGGSNYAALSVDASVTHAGTASLKFTVTPALGYAGGVIVASTARDLSGYNALTFWVKASRAAVLDKAGFGNDNTGGSLYEAMRTAISIDTSWSQVIVPIPLPSRLAHERGLFTVAQGIQTGALVFWIDDIQFAVISDGSIADPRPTLANVTLTGLAGYPLNLAGTASTTYTIGGVNRTVSHSPGYFTFESSDLTILSATEGAVNVVGAGTTTVSARLGALTANGTLTVRAIAPPPAPAPSPTVAASRVASLYSDTYKSFPGVAHAVDSWQQFGTPGITVQDVDIKGNPTKLYEKLNTGFIGAEFRGANEVRDSTLTHFHMDAWVPGGETAPTLKVKLVDFGADGVFGGGNDSQHELTFDANSLPALTADAWVALDVPLANFTGLSSHGHLAQLILSGGPPVLFVDNTYFHK